MRQTGHKYYKQLKQCPWCEILGAGGPDLFVTVNVLGRAADQFDLDGAWRGVEAIRLPAEMGRVAPAVVALPIAKFGGFGGQWWAVLLVLAAVGTLLSGPVSLVPVVVALVCFSAAVVIWVRSEPARKTYRECREKLAVIQEEFKKKHAALVEIETRHASEYRAGAKLFQDRLRVVAAAHLQLKRAPAELAQELASLNARKRELQLQGFLQAQFIDKAQISGVGSGRKAVLASHGVETAWDINAQQLEGISGIGPVVRQSLFAWRASVEARFTFNAAKAVDPAQQRLIQQKHAAKVAQSRTALTSGAAQLRAIAADVDQKRQKAVAEIAVIQGHLSAMKARVEELTGQ